MYGGTMAGIVWTHRAWGVVLLGCCACTQSDPAAETLPSDTEASSLSSSGDVPTTSGGAETGDETSGGPTDTDDPDDPTDPPPGEEPSGNNLDQNALFTCMDRPALPKADVRLIDRYEWTRSVGTWAGTNLSRNPLYARADHRYSSYSDGETIDATMLSLYFDVVGEAGTAWSRGKNENGRIRTVIEDPETQCFLNDVEPSPTCVRYFVRRYLERGALYRPADDAQVDALYDYAQDILVDETDVSQRKQTIHLIASAAWMTSDALHRPELGAGTPDEYGRLRLDTWELAQSIAYALSRAPAGTPSVFRKSNVGYSPGDVDGDLGGFLDAAADASIYDPEVIASLVRTYIGGLDPDRRDLLLEPGDNRDWENRGEYSMAMGVRGFFREWLDYGTLAGKTPKVEVSATSAWSGETVEKSYHNIVSGSNGYENSLVTQLDDMIARIVAADKDVFSALLTSRMFYTPAIAGYQEGETSIWKTTSAMNRVYNVAGITERTREARWIELPANERAGVLTHPAWLGAHALSFENDPNLVHRGKWIREELLCQNVPDLPLNVDAALSEASREQSARQRISEQIDADPYCAGCHAFMNPLGYPFEIYNHAGFFRIEDHGEAPNGSSVLANMPSPELNGPVADAVELSQRLAGSPYAKRCFIRQTFRYFAGREETMHDACTMVALEKAYDASEGSLTELLIALFNSDSFQFRVPN